MSSNSRPDAGGATRLLVVAGVVVALAAIGAYQQVTAPATSDTSVAKVQTRLDALPQSFDGWTGTDTEVDAKQLRVAEAQAHLSRTYTKGGQAVAALVLYGEPGPLGAHTPEVCYGANGHRPIGRPYRTPGPDGFGELWTIRFESPGTPASIVEVTWGWGVDGTWSASDTPRVDFAGHSRIYKLYVSRRLPSNAGDSPPNEFLAPLLRELRTTLAASPAPTSTTP